MSDIYHTYYTWERIRDSYLDHHMIRGDEDTDIIEDFFDQMIEIEENLNRFCEGFSYKPSKKYLKYLKEKPLRPSQGKIPD